MRVDHVAVRVQSLEDATQVFSAFGFVVTSQEKAPGVGTRVCYVRLGGVDLELYEDVQATPGIDHIAIRVPALGGAVAALAELGIYASGDELDATRGSRALLLDQRSTAGIRMHLCVRDEDPA